MFYDSRDVRLSELKSALQTAASELSSMKMAMHSKDLEFKDEFNRITREQEVPLIN